MSEHFDDHGLSSSDILTNQEGNTFTTVISWLTNSR